MTNCYHEAYVWDNLEIDIIDDDEIMSSLCFDDIEFKRLQNQKSDRHIEWLELHQPLEK